MNFQLRIFIAIIICTILLIIGIHYIVLEKERHDIASEAGNSYTDNTFAFERDKTEFQKPVTKLEFAAVTMEISRKLDTLCRKKPWELFNQVYVSSKGDLRPRSFDLSYFDRFGNVLFYDTLQNSLSEFTPDHRSTALRIRPKDDVVREMGSGLYRLLMNHAVNPIVMFFYTLPRTTDLSSGFTSIEGHDPVAIELSVVGQHKRDLVQAVKDHPISADWELRDTTFNLIFINKTLSDVNPYKSVVRNFLFVENKPNFGVSTILQQERLIAGRDFLNFINNRYYQRSDPYCEDAVTGKRVFQFRDDLFHLTLFRFDDLPQKPSVNVFLMGLGLAFCLLLAFIIYIIFWEIKTHVGYFGELTQEFAEKLAKEGKSSKILIDYYNSVLDFYYSILSKLIPKFRRDVIKDVFQFNLNEFSGIIAEMERLRENLEQQVVERTRELEETIKSLRQTQARLVQTEKMALLGQLTAGIAHEIKNPLNFVNNFADISAEMIMELRQKMKTFNGRMMPAQLDELTQMMTDIMQNMDKITEHGKRADSIVKGMLLHARSGIGEKTPTDINALLDEYVKLSYHGFRAADKSFNVSIKTEYDASIPLVSLVPQDMSRVFTNIITNGCYSAYEKKKSAGGEFLPELKVVTRNLPDKIEIRIRDNGKGISSGIRDKIFNPFFTTKPAGEGTGLGLSISYDVLVNGHGGWITVDSQEDEYAEFIILLPKP